MKKLSYLFLVLLSLSFVACSSDDSSSDNNNSSDDLYLKVGVGVEYYLSIMGTCDEMILRILM